MPGRPHIGKEVGPPETVDRLFGVADQKEDALFAPEDAPEDGILDRVRVLKLIDQRSPVIRPDRLCQSSPPVFSRAALSRIRRSSKDWMFCRSFLAGSSFFR